MELIDSQTRQQMIEYIEKISQTSSTKIKNLLEKEKEFLDEGNKHKEKFSPRQFYIAVDPIIEAEYQRCKIMELTKETPLTSEEIAKKLNISSAKALNHIAVLRKKNLIKLEEFEGNIPKYLAIPEAESEVK
jgi:predicted HTH transcriptional regulator